MRFLSLALYAEGPTDHAFLQNILYRLTHETAFRLSKRPVEIAEDFVRGEPSGAASARKDRIEHAFANALSSNAINLLFLHSDGGTDEAAARRERIDPFATYAKTRWPLMQSVPVVPIRETEAWAIADTSALIAELGTRKSAANLSLDESPLMAEREPSPKAKLRRAQGLARQRSRARTKQGIEGIPAGLGARVHLDTLRQLSAFKNLENDLEQALKALWQLQDLAP